MKIIVSVSVAALLAAVTGNPASLLAELENQPGQPVAAAPGAPQPVAVAPANDPAPSLASLVQDFLRNDDSSYEWRSARALADKLGVAEGDVETAVLSSWGFNTRRSTTGKGLLIQFAA